MAVNLKVKQNDGSERELQYKDIKPQEDKDDAEFLRIAQMIQPYTMMMNEGLDSAYANFHAVKYLVENNISGDIVECGVWKGGAMMLMAEALKYFGDTSRTLYLYDTYDGMTEPEDIDIDVNGNSMRARWLEGQKMNAKMGFGDTLAQVKENIRKTGYDESKLVYVEGDVLETIPETAPEHIALLRLDTDWYKSTKHELEQLYPRIVSKGVLVVDDYGWCKGSHTATDEYFANEPYKPMLCRIATDARLAIKP